jgi:hypothetical protein
MIKLCPFIIEDIHADSRLWIVVRAKNRGEFGLG